VRRSSACQETGPGHLPGGIADLEKFLVWVDRNGATEPLPLPPRNFGLPRLSPDGKRLAFSTSEKDRRSIWVYEISRGTLSLLTTEGQSSWAIWTPDGKRLTFSSTAPGLDNLFWKPATGTVP